MNEVHLHLRNDSPSFHPVHPLIRAFGPRDLHHAKGRGPEQDALLKPLLEAHLQPTGSAKAAAILADWPSWKAQFKLLVPPSEKAAMGLAERQAVVA